MKFFNLFSFLIICIAFVKADDDKCNYSNFNECINNIKGILFIGGKTAESQCPTDTCKNVRNDYTDCLKTTWKNNKDYSSSLSKGIAGLLSFGSLEDSILCETTGLINKVYCYDDYTKRKGNQTLMEDFYCSSCGEILNKNIKTIRLSMLDENDEDYKAKKKEIENYNICNGALANASLKIVGVLLVSLASALFMF
ncbi:hypothetical protein PIROE2DRAFT_62234 [Piromyces sp. E2]|nr:hypothetical protein PIROE2DRAFT_62234 [Piromyces sp. E2]|eukprot:OUM61879.1 hypothetical protein PIROE2DRAFT_62234 [Piromyces sp. E2]